MKHPIAIGKLGSPYGVRGWLRVHSYTEPTDNITEYRNWQRNTKTGWQSIDVDQCQRHGKHILAKINGIDSPEDAKKLVNSELFIDRNDLPELDEDDGYYWSDLMGCSVTTTEGVELGYINDIFDTGSNDVFVVQKCKSSKRHLIPHVSGIIIDIDITNKCIKADWDPEF